MSIDEEEKAKLGCISTQEYGLDMDLLHKCYAIIDYRNRVVRLQFPNKLGQNEKGVVQIQQAKADS